MELRYPVPLEEYRLAPFRVVIFFGPVYDRMAAVFADRFAEELHPAIWEAVKAAGRILRDEIVLYIKFKKTPGMRKPINYTGALARSIGYKIGPGYFTKGGRYRREAWMVIGSIRKVPAPPAHIGDPVETYAAVLEAEGFPPAFLTYRKIIQLKTWAKEKMRIPVPSELWSKLLLHWQTWGTYFQPYLAPAVRGAMDLVAAETARVYREEILAIWEIWEAEVRRR